MTTTADAIPIELSAHERAAPPDHCGACHTPLVREHMHTEVIPGHGLAWLCNVPKACRERAEAAGIWKKYP